MNLPPKPRRTSTRSRCDSTLCYILVAAGIFTWPSLASAQTVTAAETRAAGGIRHATEFGQEILILKYGRTTAKLAPAAGANVYSINVADVEFLHQPESPSRLAGVSCGVPILYPTPNRVKDATFTFGGKTVNFPANAGKNFIHGLVNKHTWSVVAEDVTDESVQVVLEANFLDDSPLVDAFPFPHALKLAIKVQEDRVRWTYTVDNSKGQVDVPFGFALHPYFIYQGERARTFLTILASHWMEASSDRLPTGNLVPADELEFALGKPMSLEDTKFDDVFWGLTPDAPTRIEYRDTKRQITIAASKEFTHLVVWTPDRPYFGVESQTCSTDAHNLHAAGKTKEAHLQICAPGEQRTGWVEYQFAN